MFESDRLSDLACMCQVVRRWFAYLPALYVYFIVLWLGRAGNIKVAM